MKRLFQKSKLLFVSSLAILFFTGNDAFTREPYHVSLTVGAATAKVSAPNLVDLKRDLRTSSIEKLLPFYSPNDPLSLGINLRGLLAQASFAANSTTLVVNIPNAGVTATFTGGTRDESIALFKDFIHDAGPRPNY